MQNMQGAGNDTGNDTGNTDDTSTIKSTALRSEGGKGNKNWHGFQTNEFFIFQ